MDFLREAGKFILPWQVMRHWCNDFSVFKHLLKYWVITVPFSSLAAVINVPREHELVKLICLKDI